MIELICTHCGGRLLIDEEKVVLDETCAQLVQTLFCSYCGVHYAMGDELPRVTSITIAQNLDIEAVKGQLVGISVDPDEEGSVVNIDQHMDVGEVQGMLVGVQIGASNSGKMTVGQKVDAIEGVMIGGVLGEVTLSDIPASPARMTDLQTNGLPAPHAETQAPQSLGTNASEPVNTRLEQQPIEPQSEPIPVQVTKKPWWQFWK